MSLDLASAATAASSISDLDEPRPPIFTVQSVQMQFSIASDFVAAQVANGVLVLALYSGRIMRIDLDSPNDVDGMEAIPDNVSPLTVFARHRPAQESIRSRDHSATVL